MGKGLCLGQGDTPVRQAPSEHREAEITANRHLRNPGAERQGRLSASPAHTMLPLPFLCPEKDLWPKAPEREMNRTRGRSQGLPKSVTPFLG